MENQNGHEEEDEECEAKEQVVEWTRVKRQKDSPWAVTLETMALKKTANENVFEKIREEFKDSLAGEDGSDVYPFSIDQLRRKYKWLKNEWKTINDKHQNQSR